LKYARIAREFHLEEELLETVVEKGVSGEVAVLARVARRGCGAVARGGACATCRRCKAARWRAVRAAQGGTVAWTRGDARRRGGARRERGRRGGVEAAVAGGEGWRGERA
jgi:hypothetical protein